MGYVDVSRKTKFSIRLIIELLITRRCYLFVLIYPVVFNITYISLSLSVSVYVDPLSLYLCLSVSVCLPLCLCLTLSLSVCLSVCLSLYLSLSSNPLISSCHESIITVSSIYHVHLFILPRYLFRVALNQLSVPHCRLESNICRPICLIIHNPSLRTKVP